MGTRWKIVPPSSLKTTSANQQPPSGRTGLDTTPWLSLPSASPQMTLMLTDGIGFALPVPESSVLADLMKWEAGGRTRGSRPP